MFFAFFLFATALLHAQTKLHDEQYKIESVRKTVSLKNNCLNLHTYFDNSIVEVFVNEGEEAFTAQIFPDETDTGIELFSTGGNAKFGEINIWEMKTV